MLRTPGWWQAACLGLGVPVQVLEILDSNHRSPTTTTTTPQSNGQTMKKDENETNPPSPLNVLPGKPKLLTETGLDNIGWMTSIPDETPFSTITIVGIRLLFGKKQVWTMKQKLKDGIRYFDINVGVWRATEKEYHIRSTKWMVEEVLLPISIFLRTHSHETVLLKLTIHGRTKTIVDDFTNTSTEKFKDIMWTKRSVPTMKEARGKIVFLKTKSFHFGVENHKSKILDSNMLKNFEKNIELQRSDICGGQLVVTESLDNLDKRGHPLLFFAGKFNLRLSGKPCFYFANYSKLAKIYNIQSNLSSFKFFNFYLEAFIKISKV
uniref:Phosphatidylinositol-specific phospholipase C X domain-containing protein n=1 Tax=Oryzias latipes TaxID=8090 RepID=A0A3P9MDZ9_ORYLA